MGSGGVPSGGGSSTDGGGLSGAGGSSSSAIDASQDANRIEDDVWSSIAPKTYGDGSILPDSPASVRFLGAPTILSVLPQTVVAGHTLVLSGENLTDVFWNTAGVRVVLTGVLQGAAMTMELPILRGMPNTLIVTTPLGLDKILPGPDKLEVTTPLGLARSSTSIFVVGTNGFGMGGGEGLFGAVYALSTLATKLPNFGDPRSLTAACTDPLIRSDTTTDCPFNSIVVPNLDVPLRNFTEGFPGVAQTLLEFFAIRFRGVLTFEKAGTYGFRLCSDDGSNLYIVDPKAEGGTPGADGSSGLVPLIANDGVHEDICKTGTIDVAAPGTFPVIVDYFQGPAFHIALLLYWTPPGEVEEIIPTTHLTALLPGVPMP
jgi:hypothetical protein